MCFMISCKHCDKEFFLGFGFVRHLFKGHNIEATKNDKKVIRKKRLRFCLLPIILLGKLLRLITIGICFPFYLLFNWLVYEI